MNSGSEILSDEIPNNSNKRLNESVILHLNLGGNSIDIDLKTSR